MHPIICNIGPLTVYSYGAMLALAVVICTMLVSRNARQLGLNPEEIVDVVFWVVVGGIVGGRLFFIILNFEFFVSHPGEIIMIHRGGLAWQGALIVGILTALIIVKKKSLSVADSMDLFAPYIALGQAIGRVGCFLNGCCYGKSVSWGVFFPVHDMRLHPTQLYSSFGLILIFLILKRYQRAPKYPGGVFILYLVLASAQRFIVEFLRADHTGVLWNFSIFQIVSFCILMVVLYANTYFTRRSRK